MITGFEIETKPLTTVELHAANVVKNSLVRNHVGQALAMKADAIGKALANYSQEFRKPNGQAVIDGPRLRKIVNYLRVSGECPFIIGTSKGYFVAETEIEVRDAIRSLYERCSAIKSVADSMNNAYRAQFPNSNPIK